MLPDISLVFAPQWSPYYPPLSLAALAAWLRGQNYRVQLFDENLGFYRWLYSEEFQAEALRLIDLLPLSQPSRSAVQCVLLNCQSFRNDQFAFQPESCSTAGSLLERQFIAAGSFNTYLNAVSTLLEGFSLAAHDFELPSGRDLTDLISSPPALLGLYAEGAAERIAASNASVYGISCIGQQQLFFTLLIGSRLKARSDRPVIIGGTVLPRLHEKGDLPSEWFGKYFDGIVCNEGELGCERIVKNARAGSNVFVDVPGLVHVDSGHLVRNAPALPLRMQDVPAPDFAGLPLSSYFGSSLQLPLLMSRGCYWGRCEFCHHGMVYNGAFSRSNEEKLIEEVRSLHSRFGATNFVFHDEALPPGLLRRFANRLPPATETGFAFSGLIKFEPAFSASDFDAAARAGFRSLYIGLESASERLLEKMLKPTPRHIMLRNLGDARSAGIWTHCFLFFGFPGETDADASETTEFVLTRTDLISSFGCGTFMLEHGAPILARTQETQFRVWSDRGSRYSLYYNYETVSGPSREVALRRSVELKRRAKDVDWYRATWWVPRDQQLNILARMGGEDLVQASALLQTRSSLFKLYRDGRGWAIAADRSGGVAVVDKLTGAARYFQAGDVKGLPVPYGPLTSAEASRLLLYLMGDDWTANTLEKKALDVASAGERGC